MAKDVFSRDEHQYTDSTVEALRKLKEIEKSLQEMKVQHPNKQNKIDEEVKKVEFYIKQTTESFIMQKYKWYDIMILRNSETCLVNLDAYDRDKYASVIERSPVLQEMKKKGEEIFPSFPSLQRDLWAGLYKYDP